MRGPYEWRRAESFSSGCMSGWPIARNGAAVSPLSGRKRGVIVVARGCEDGRIVRRPFVLEYLHAEKDSEYQADHRGAVARLRRRHACARVLSDHAVGAHRHREGCSGLKANHDNVRVRGMRQG